MSLIDRHLTRWWRSQNVSAEPPVDDATFLRRVSLDLVGRIPTITEARRYLSDPADDKAVALVERLLRSPEHARHMAAVWRRAWVPQTETQQFARLAGGYERWLARRLREGTGYDRLAAEQLTVPVSRTIVPVDSDVEGGGSPAFLAVAELDPAKLAANTARAFFGINLDCAQCHDHPFARWSQAEFWQTAAFFARPASNDAESGVFEIAIGESGEYVQARFPNGPQPRPPRRVDAESGRRLLADWITDEDNRYFARNLVNRTWAQLLGRGLVEPLDDISGGNPSPHSPLLDQLAEGLAERGFQLRPIIRAIVLSRVYRSRVAGEASTAGKSQGMFAAMPVRGLTGDQLYDSIATAAGFPPESADHRRRQSFVRDFRIGRPAEAQRSLVQSLRLMNGSLTTRATSVDGSPLIAGIAEAPFLDRSDQIETLFLAAYTRSPTAEERAWVGDYLRETDNRRAALADLFWAMLNSAEFNSNH